MKLIFMINILAQHLNVHKTFLCDVWLRLISISGQIVQTTFPCQSDQTHFTQVIWAFNQHDDNYYTISIFPVSPNSLPPIPTTLPLQPFEEKLFNQHIMMKTATWGNLCSSKSLPISREKFHISRCESLPQYCANNIKAGADKELKFVQH